MMDDVLNGPAAWAAEAGTEPSSFAGANMRALAAFSYNWTVMANGDDTGFTGEVAFCESTPATGNAAQANDNRAGTALITVATDEPHPELGSGALFLLRLPLSVDPTEAPDIANQLNLLESSGESPTKLVGAWCAQQSTLCFVSFFPTFLARPGILENLLVDASVRVQWAGQVLT